MKKRSNCYSFTINGVVIEAYTIAGLARCLGKSKDTILRYEEKDVFPLAPFSKNNIRYYPVSLAKKLVPIVKQIPSNRPPSAEIIIEINKLFKEEKLRLCQVQK